jgi:hypothetical protein
MVEREDDLPRSDGDQSIEDGTKSRNDAVYSGGSESLYGRDGSAIFWGNEEAALGSSSRCRATWRAKGTDRRELWIPEEVGCRLPVHDPPCRPQSIRPGRTFGRRRQLQPECNKDIIDRALKQQLQGIKRIKEPRRQTAAISEEGVENLLTESEGGAQDSDHIWEAQERSKP